MSLKICGFCQREYFDEGFKGFCCKDCELQSKKTSWTTMSVRRKTKAMLKSLQNDIYQKVYKEIPFSDLIEHILEIGKKALGKSSLSDRIINDYKYYL